MAGINVGGSAHDRRSRIVGVQSTLNPRQPNCRVQDRAVLGKTPRAKGNLFVLAKLRPRGLTLALDGRLYNTALELYSISCIK